mmetsp:Transcript_103789/g.206300  ORF Transcript_103789/g.206300 Transcript_103789/m.206300 type:complete len:283 (+) Transcript_103789:585-1433(+)
MHCGATLARPVTQELPLARAVALSWDGSGVQATPTEQHHPNRSLPRRQHSHGHPLPSQVLSSSLRAKQIEGMWLVRRPRLGNPLMPLSTLMKRKHACFLLRKVRPQSHLHPHRSRFARNSIVHALLAGQQARPTQKLHRERRFVFGTPPSFLWHLRGGAPSVQELGLVLLLHLWEGTPLVHELERALLLQSHHVRSEGPLLAHRRLPCRPPAAQSDRPPPGCRPQQALLSSRPSTFQLEDDRALPQALAPPNSHQSSLPAQPWSPCHPEALWLQPSVPHCQQ